EYGGSAVTGRTFPADIWHDFMLAAKDIDAQHGAEDAARNGSKNPNTTSTDTSGASGGPSSSGDTGSGTGTGSAQPPPPPSPGRGRDTKWLLAAVKRHGSSTALVIPTRGAVATTRSRHAGPRGSNRMGPDSRSVALRSTPMPSACVSFPGPEHRSSTRSRPRR